MPEGWGTKGNKGEWGEEGDDDVDMEITFTPGLSEKKGDGEETTLDKYQRKMREKRRKRKEEMKERHAEKEADGDDFFEVDEEEVSNTKKGKKDKKPHKAGKPDTDATPTPRIESTAAELALVATSDNPHAEPAHFDMKAILKAEKKKGKKGKGKKRGQGGEEEKDLQEDFTLDVNDERFKVLHEDPSFAIDPTNPQ